MLRPLRVLLRSAAPLFVLALAAKPVVGQYEPYDPPAHVASNDPTCHRMSDADSSFQTGLALLLAVQASYTGWFETWTFDASIFEPIDQALPALTACLAETNPLQLLMALATSPDAVQCMNDITAMLSTPVNAYSNAIFGDTVCPAVATIAPCLTNVLVPAVETMMADTNGCCDALNDQITAAFGAPLRPTATTMVQLLDNVFCSERSTESSPPETCGDSLVRNWVPSLVGDDQKAFWSILNSFQIPNDQVCKAVNSEAFTTTMRTSQQYGSAEVTPFGLCYSQLDALTQYVCDLPVWTLGADASTVVSKASLFADGQCLRGSAFLSWASDENGSIMKTARAMDDVAAVLHGLFGVDRSSDSTSSYSSDEGSGQGSGVFDPYGDDTGSNIPGSASSGADDEPFGSMLEINEDDTPAPVPARVKASTHFKKPAPPVKYAPPASKLQAPPMKVALATKKTAPAMKVALAKQHKALRRRLADSEGVADAARVLFSELSYFSEQLCFHLPNGVQCNFPGEQLMLLYGTKTNSTYTGEKEA